MGIIEDPLLKGIYLQIKLKSQQIDENKGIDNVEALTSIMTLRNSPLIRNALTRLLWHHAFAFRPLITHDSFDQSYEVL